MSYEAEEQRQLLKLTLQNLKLEGNSVKFELVKPFDKVFACTGSQSWLPDLDSNQEPSGYATPARGRGTFGEQVTFL